MRRRPQVSPMASTMQILEELKKYPQGIKANDMTIIMGRKMQSPLSKLHAYGVIDRVIAKDRDVHTREYLYRTKLPRALAPPTADDDNRSDSRFPSMDLVND